MKTEKLAITALFIVVMTFMFLSCGTPLRLCLMIPNDRYDGACSQYYEPATRSTDE